MHLRSRTRASVLLVIGLALAACSDSATTPHPTPDSTPDSTPAPASQATTDRTEVPATVLPAGKSDLALPPGRYASPPGFAPALQVAVRGSGWRSTHRGPDGFDLSRPDPTRDVPLVALVVVTPAEG